MNAVTQFVNVMANPQRATDQIKRDQWDHYILPHPETGKEQAWYRATTIAETVKDRFGLEQWAKRNVTLGIGARRDLYAQAAAAKPDDKKTLNQIVKQAEEAAKSKSGANLGSALHRFTERLDNGEEFDAPPPWDADLVAYQNTMAANGITIVPGWLERVLLVPEIDTAGTCDRLCNGMFALPRIGDLKTSENTRNFLKYGMVTIPLQLAIYAHATHWYDPTTHELHEMPHIDQDIALVMHLPVGQATCTIYEVDIQAGWEAVQLALDVRRWRQRKDLAQIINAPSRVIDKPNKSIGWTNKGWQQEAIGLESASPQDEQAYLDLLDRTEWVRDRVQAIKDAGNPAATALAIHWTAHPDIPTFPKGGPTTDAQVTTIAEMCAWVEMEYELPFGPSDPTTPKQTKSMKRETA